MIGIDSTSQSLLGRLSVVSALDGRCQWMYESCQRCLWILLPTETPTKYWACSDNIYQDKPNSIISDFTEVRICQTRSQCNAPCPGELGSAYENTQWWLKAGGFAYQWNDSFVLTCKDSIETEMWKLQQNNWNRMQDSVEWTHVPVGLHCSVVLFNHAHESTSYGMLLAPCSTCMYLSKLSVTCT